MTKTDQDIKVEKELIKFAMKSKVYEFGTGRTSLVTKNKFITALNEFSNFYEHLIETDLVKKQQSGQFDYLSLINLLKLYLNKVMKQFKGWSSKDQSTLDLIIERTKKAFFSYKLNKKFISSKQHYVKINVFERLNTIETFSLKRLFQTIKGFLIRYRGQVLAKKDPKVDRVIELTLPQPLPAEERADLPIQVLVDCGIDLKTMKQTIFGDIVESNEVQKMLENGKLTHKEAEHFIKKLEKYIPIFDEKLKEYKNRIEQNTSEQDKLQKIKDEEKTLMQRNFRYENIDQILEKIVARALFELIDFSKISKIYDLHVDEDNRVLFSQRSDFQEKQMFKNRVITQEKTQTGLKSENQNTVGSGNLSKHPHEKTLKNANKYLADVKNNLLSPSPISNLMNTPATFVQKEISTKLKDFLRS